MQATQEKELTGSSNALEFCRKTVKDFLELTEDGTTTKEMLLYLLNVYIWSEANELATMDELEKFYCQVAHIRSLLDDIPKMRVALDVIVV